MNLPESVPAAPQLDDHPAKRQVSPQIVHVAPVQLGREL